MAKRPVASYMPLSIRMSGERCLVVGGGGVALRKISVLLRYGARITCVSPELVEGVRALVRDRAIRYVKRKFSARTDMGRYRLVVAATDDRQVNRRIARLFRSEHVLVNVVDGSASGDVIVPAIYNGKGFSVGVSTDGHDPSRARSIRDKIRDEYSGRRFKP